MSLLRTTRIFSVSRNCFLPQRGAHWNKDWKPGPYPQSEEEKVAAAKKYGLLREEYVPYPDDGHGIGDYPDLPVSPAESRDPYYPWDFPEYRRNFGEVMHHEANIYGEDRCDPVSKKRFTMPQMFASLLGAIGLSALLYQLGEDACFLPVLPSTPPGPGVVHYKYPSSGDNGGGHH